jgi:sodium/proline symporter
MGNSLSERATGESAWCLLDLPGFAYATGLSSIWTAIGCVLGIFLAWIFLAKRFRDEAESYDAYTLPEYIAKKYAEMGGLIRILSAITITFFFFFYIGAQFSGAGKVLNTLFGIGPTLGIVIGALVILPYTVRGGFRSVVAVDDAQALLMLTTLVVTPLLGLLAIWGGRAEFAFSIGEALTKPGGGMASLTGGVSGFAAGLLIFSNLAWFFGYLGGQPQLSARFMATKSREEILKGRNLAITWTGLAYLGAISIGLLALVLFGPNTVADPEYILPHMLITLYPPVFAALLLAGAIAAMISTADSQLLVTSTLLSHDIYGKIIHKGKLSSKELLKVSRITTFILGMIALLVALSSKELIYTMVSYAWAGVGCTLSPIIILSFYWKRFNGKATVVSLLTGLIFTVIWIAIGMEEIVSARGLTFIVTLVAGVITGWLSSKRQPIIHPFS